VIVLEIEKCL